jgi:hypothetical protein
MSIKPVAWMHASGSVITAVEKTKQERASSIQGAMVSGYNIPLYAIPDTHRVVSVETLLRWRSGLVSGNQAYCLVPPAEIQAIIEDKENT